MNHQGISINPDNPLGRDVFVGAALAAIDRAVDGVAIAAVSIPHPTCRIVDCLTLLKAAPTKAMRQFNDQWGNKLPTLPHIKQQHFSVDTRNQIYACINATQQLG